MSKSELNLLCWKKFRKFFLPQMRKMLLHFPVDNMPLKMPAKYGGQQQKTEFVTSKTVLAKKLTAQKCIKFALLKKFRKTFWLHMRLVAMGFQLDYKHNQMHAKRGHRTRASIPVWYAFAGRCAQLNWPTWFWEITPPNFGF